MSVRVFTRTPIREGMASNVHIVEAQKQIATQEFQRRMEEEKRKQRERLEEQKKAEIARWTLESRQKFYESLEAEETKAREEFQSQIEKEKQIRKSEFERKLSLEAFRLLRAGAKRPQVEAWKQSQRAEFEQQLQAWEEKQWQLFEQQISAEKQKAIQQFEIELQQKLPEVEQELSSQIESALFAWENQILASLYQALTQVPQEAKIKEIKLEEEGWKISYEIEKPKTKEQIISEVREKLGYEPGETVELIPGGGSLAWGFRVVKQVTIEEAIAKWLENPESIQLTPKGQMTPEEIRGIIDVTTLAFGAVFAPVATSKISVSDLIIGGAASTGFSEVEKIISTGTHLTVEEAISSFRFGVEATPAWVALTGPIEKIGSWIKETEVYKRLVSTVKFSRAYRFYYEHLKVPAKAFYQTRIKLPAEKWMVKHWKWYRSRIAKTLAPELADIPEFPYPAPSALFKQEVAWQIAESPKSTALLITKYTGKPEKMLPDWVGEHWIKRVTVTGGATQLLSPEQAVKPVVEPLTKIFIPSTQPTIRETTSLLKPLIGAFVIKAAFRPRILQELVPPVKAIEAGIIKIENLTQQFSIPRQLSIPKISVKLMTEAFVSPRIKFRSSTIQGQLSIPKMEAPSIPKVKSPSKPFKIKSKRKKGKLSPLLYGWGWMISPVMEPPEVMKLMFGGGKKK